MEITFHLPEDFELPLFYTTESPDQIALALRLGAETVSQMVKNASNLIREETHEQTVRELEEKYLVKVEREKKERKKLEDALDTAKEQLTALEKSNAMWQKDLRERAESLMAPVLQAKDREIEHLKQMVQLVHTLESKFDKMNDSFSKTQNNSYVKGRIGEHQVEELLKLSLDCEVYPVNKEAYAGDHHLVRGKGKYKYLVDAKNYTRMLNQQEVDKLHRDLRVNADAIGAILISLNSGITGHSRAGDIDIEFNESGKPIVYIGNLNRRDEASILIASLRPFFEVVEQMVEYRKKNTTQTSESAEKLQQQMGLVGNLVRSHLQSILTLKNTFVNHKKKADAMYTEQLSLIVQQESNIKALLSLALGSEETVQQAIQDSQMPLPSNIYKKSARTELSDQEAKFVEWMEKTFVYEDGKEMELKHFMEKAQEEGFSEKKFREMREKLFADSCWAKGAKKVYGFTLRHNPN